MMLSIFPEAADFTLVGLGKGRKKGGLLALFSAGHRCPFGPKARCTFSLLPGCDSDRSIYNLGRAFEARARTCRSESIRVPINRRRVSARRFPRDRKSTRLNSSHGYISYAVFCLKKKK